MNLFEVIFDNRIKMINCFLVLDIKIDIYLAKASHIFISSLQIKVESFLIGFFSGNFQQ